MKNSISLFLFLLLFSSILMGQESNVFKSEPHEIKKFLGRDFKKIEIEIVKSRGQNPNVSRGPTKSVFRVIEFNGEGKYSIINTTKEDESDTTVYQYDKCGNLVYKKGHSVNSRYSNRYKACKLLSKESNETEIDPSGFTHQWNLIKFVYNKAGLLEQELIYDFNDTTIIKFSNEYKYKGTFLDSMNEYYYDEDGVKLKNRMTKCFYSTHIDSSVVYSSEYYVIDKREYQYNAAGKLSLVNEANNSNYIYTYNSKNDIESIMEEMESKLYRVNYLE